MRWKIIDTNMIKIEKKILDIIRDKNIKEYKYEVVMP
jgi:hypothetical protein